jgi:hypothetical protein
VVTDLGLRLLFDKWSNKAGLVVIRFSFSDIAIILDKRRCRGCDEVQGDMVHIIRGGPDRVGIYDSCITGN